MMRYFSTKRPTSAARRPVQTSHRTLLGANSMGVAASTIATRRCPARIPEMAATRLPLGDGQRDWLEAEAELKALKT